MSDVKVLAISGSLRQGSYNTSLLRVAGSLLPPGMTMTLQTIHEIPLFNADVEAKGLPAPVVALKEAIRAADGVLISTPEYNNSLPGVLKNTVDWVSRGGKQPFERKPIVVISASNGRFGGARSQVAWLPVFATLGALWMHTPQFALSMGGEAFLPDGSLKDDKTREKLRAVLAAFDTWCRMHAAAAKTVGQSAG
jgi:chromate reductase